jgi:hypothetical protein
MARRRKSKISRLPAEQRAYIESLLREDRWTLDEIVHAVRDRFPEAEVSRSGVHRFQAGFDEMMGRMREINQAASALVGELGDGIGEKAGALLVQAVTTLATNAAMRANDDTSIDDIRKLGQTTKHVMDSQRLSLQTRQEIEEAARNRLLREQQERLSSTVKAGGLSQEFADTLRKQVLGIE